MDATIIVQLDIKNRKIVELPTDNFQPNFNDFIYWIHLDLDDKEKVNAILAKLNLSYEALSLGDETEFFPHLTETDESLNFQILSPTSITLNRNGNISYTSTGIVLTPNYCLTLSKGMPSGIAAFKREYARAIHYAETPCFILFLILDNVINEYLEILLEFERLADMVELDFRHITTTTYQKVVAIKRRVIKTRRYVAILVDILMRITGRKMTVISDHCRASLLDTMTHAQMIVTQADAIREGISSTLDAINNALMGRLNEIIKVLTIYTLFFMPLTLITGIYGMNFKNMPELSWKYGYPMAITAMVICVAAMFYAFKKRKWL